MLFCRQQAGGPRTTGSPLLPPTAGGPLLAVAQLEKPVYSGSVLDSDEAKELCCANKEVDAVLSSEEMGCHQAAQKAESESRVLEGSGALINLGHQTWSVLVYIYHCK